MSFWVSLTADPHGEPIPDKNGKVTAPGTNALHELSPGYTGIIMAVKDSDSSLLKYLHKIGAIPGKKIKLMSKEEYDDSLDD